MNALICIFAVAWPLVVAMPVAGQTPPQPAAPAAHALAAPAAAVKPKAEKDKPAKAKGKKPQASQAAAASKDEEPDAKPKEASVCTEENPSVAKCTPDSPEPCCRAFREQWHHVYAGLIGSVAGAMRGYNHQTVQAIVQFGFKDMAFEVAAGGANVRVQELPNVEPYQLSMSVDGRTIFYGNSRHRTGFFLGGGATYVPRDEIEIMMEDVSDTRTEWWIRAPLGIDVQLPVTPIDQGLNVVLVGRGFLEAWIPVGRLDSEVTVMFGFALGVLFGDHNERAGFTD